MIQFRRQVFRAEVFVVFPGYSFHMCSSVRAFIPSILLSLTRVLTLIWGTKDFKFEGSRWLDGFDSTFRILRSLGMYLQCIQTSGSRGVF